jgi:hypothetical protein
MSLRSPEEPELGQRPGLASRLEKLALIPSDRGSIQFQELITSTW